MSRISMYTILMKYIKCEAIIFDMDGVITDTMPYHYQAWKHVFEREGVAMSYLDVYQREGQTGINAVREIFKIHGQAISFKKAKEVLAEKEELLKRIFKQKFIVGARQFLHKMHKQNFILALATGTARHEFDKILPDHLKNLFSVIITGSDVKKGKPDPEPYKKVLKKLRLNPKKSIVIENAPLGIESAKSAGLRCLALETSLPRKYLKKADYVFSSFKDLVSSITFQRDES